MKIIFISVCFCFLALSGNAQNKTADSIFFRLQENKTDTGRIGLMNQILYYVYELTQEERIDYSKKILNFSRKDNDKVLESVIRAELGYILAINGNALEGTELAYSGLDMAKKHRNSTALGIIYNDLGVCFRENDANKSISLFLTAISYLEKGGDDMNLSSSYSNVSKKYIEKLQIDSALFYAQKSYELSLSRHIINNNSSILLNLGNIHYTYLHNKAIGLEYARKATQEAMTEGSPDDYVRVFTGMAKLFEKDNQIDSALFYINKALSKKEKARYRATLEVYDVYKSIYRKINSDSALKYYALYETVVDTIDKMSDAQQQQLLSIKKELEFDNADQQRKQNIQYALLALGIITFVILFLALSRRHITNTKVIQFLGVVALLVVFEFLNLLLHPFLERITHHNPILMLLALVCIAALLVPLHHKLEKWATHKLVEKNKQIRLAAAKKTIEQLEKDNSKIN